MSYNEVAQTLKGKYIIFLKITNLNRKNRTKLKVKIVTNRKMAKII